MSVDQTNTIYKWKTHWRDDTQQHTQSKKKKTNFSSFILLFETRWQRTLTLEALERDWCGPGEVILLALELSYIKTLESTAGKRDLRDSGALPYRFAAPPPLLG
jgi:hypothetical protein